MKTPEELACTAILEDALVCGQVSPQLVANCSEGQLLMLLPVILSAVQESETPSTLWEPLKERICLSRKVKLRFLLVRKHPAFLTLPTKLYYFSNAYGGRSVMGSRVSARSSACLTNGDDPYTLRVPVDMVDLQSEDFFRDWIFRPTTREKESLGLQLLSHPFRVNQLRHEPFPDELSVGSHDDDFEYDGDIFQTARIRKVSGQRIVELRRLKFEADEVKPSNLEPLLPRVLVRENQDVLKVQAAQLLFYLLNHVWTRTCSRYEDADSAPLSITFDATATHARKGLLQTYCHVQTFLTFNFEFWRDTKGHDPLAVDHFVRSAAGAFTAGYICGVHSKNGEEMCVKDGEAVFLRDCDGIFEQGGGPRIAPSRKMRECFKELRVWDEFRACCLRAFDVARESHDQVFPMVTGLFSRCGVSETKVNAYLAGKNSLNLGERRGFPADAAFRNWLG